jgi:hypothetical protein
MLATEGGGAKNNCNHIKSNLNTIFHEGKGRFATRERVFFVFSEGQIIPIIKNATFFTEAKGTLPLK